MSTLCHAYPTEAVARDGAQALLAAGVPGDHIRLLTGCRFHDVRSEPVGGFAGPVGPDAPVGTFGNVRRARWRGNGTFAGDADRQRQGTFGDIDLDLVITCDNGGHPHVTGDLQVRRMLQGAALEPDDAARGVEELHSG